MPDEEQTLGERLAATRSAQGAAARKASSLARFSHTAGAAATSKRGSKSAPREVSSRRAVPQGRDRCLGLDSSGGTGERKAFDPRFSDHCGDLREEHVSRNFAFVDGLRAKETAALAAAVRRDPADEEKAAALRAAQASAKRREADNRRKEIVAETRKKEKEAVKEGKRPYFLKKRELREIEMKRKFRELKEKGGLKKYIEKRRKRITSKDRKRLPERRPSAGGGPSTS